MVDTHEDTDGTYGRLSRKLMGKDIFSLQEMMDCYRTCKYQKTYDPYLIVEIFDIKIFVDPHILDGNNKIISIENVSYLDFRSLIIFQLCNIRPRLEIKIGQVLFICGIYFLVGEKSYHWEIQNC